MTNGCLLVPLRMMATMAALWQRHSICWPQSALDMTMGRNSLIVMCTCSHNHNPNQANKNQPCLEKAPHTHVPDASDVNCCVGGCRLSAASMPMPFHGSMKEHNHCRSDLKPEFNWI